MTVRGMCALLLDENFLETLYAIKRARATTSELLREQQAQSLLPTSDLQLAFSCAGDACC